MREAILGAVKSGRIEELRHAWELNELKPDLGVPLPAGGDPIAHWKQISGDGEGREILAALGEILDAGYVVLPLGRDLENNRIYVWPYFAEVALDKLTPSQEVELLRLVAARCPQGHAVGRQIHALAHCHRRRRHVAFFPQGTMNSFRQGPFTQLCPFKPSVTSCICKRARLGRDWDTGKLERKD